MATSLNNLAGLYYAQGDYAKAKPIQRFDSITTPVLIFVMRLVGGALLLVFLFSLTVFVSPLKKAEEPSIMTLDVCSDHSGASIDGTSIIAEPVFDISAFQALEKLLENPFIAHCWLIPFFSEKPPTT